MEKIIFSAVLLFTNLSLAVPGNLEDLENTPEVQAKLQELSAKGWEKFGTSQLSTIDSFYYTNSSQGKVLLLIVPIYGSRYLRMSCVAAVFGRGASSEYSFREFTEIAGYCK